MAGASGGNECGPRDSFGIRLWAWERGNAEQGDTIFDGPAIVERSTETELVLFHEPRFHTTLIGRAPMPLLVPGTRLWLTKNPWADPPFGLGPLWARSVSVRDHEDGALLFGSALNDFTSAASPVPIGKVTPACTATSPDLQCAPGAQVIYSSVEIAGDTPVVLEDSRPGTILLGGVSYDVRVSAQDQVSTGVSPCADYYPDVGVALDVQATHLAELLKTLEVGPLPVCTSGSDPEPSLYFVIYEVSTTTTYEGPVSYIGRDEPSQAYRFSVPGLASLTDLPPVLSIEGASALMDEPALGQTFWLSFPGLRAQALRVSEGGPVVLAQTFGNSSDGIAASAAELGNLLGVTVTLEETCEYDASTRLRDTVFATMPPTRVRSGTTGTFVVGDRTYRAWAWGQGAHTITIYPGP